MKMTRPSPDVKLRVIRVIERQAVVVELKRFLVHKNWEVRILVVGGDMDDEGPVAQEVTVHDVWQRGADHLTR